MEARELRELLGSLVSIPSEYYHEAAMMDFCASWLEARGLAVTRHRYREEKLTGYEGENLIAVLEGAEPDFVEISYKKELHYGDDARVLCRRDGESAFVAIKTE